MIVRFLDFCSEAQLLLGFHGVSLDHEQNYFHFIENSLFSNFSHFSLKIRIMIVHFFGFLYRRTVITRSP